MSSRPLSFVFLGLSLSSSWGNGHATTYRALIRGLDALGHDVLFLERDVPWYAEHRDLPDPDFCRLAFYGDPDALRRHWADEIAGADAVIVGSYVPDGTSVGRIAVDLAEGVTAFYDIDTPVTLAGIEAGGVPYISRGLIPDFDLYLSFTGGPTLARLERDYGARRAAALYCAVDEGRYRATGEAPDWDLGYLGTYSADRQPTLERLLIEPARRLPDRRFVVAGPQYPDDIPWPDNVERIEHLPPEAHASFYSRLRFTLNVTRSDMIAAGWSPSVRLFEAAACGTPIISDAWDGLTSFLPDGEAILVLEDSDDVVAALTRMDDEARLRLAEAARRRILSGHTGKARAGELERLVRETLSLRPQIEAGLVRSGSAA